MPKTKPKYPPYPDTDWDYASRMAARQELRHPNKFICIYCYGQGLTEEKIRHQNDCPVKGEK
jgi:hypothetical protein